MTVRPADLVRLGTEGLRGRRSRAVLAAFGVALGIAAMVAIVGVSQSSRADLLAQIDRLGTNLLTVEPGRSVDGSSTSLPPTAPAMISRIGPVQQVTAIAQLDASVRRSDRIPQADTGAITVVAASPDLPAALTTGTATGQWLNPATASFPVTVLGSTAADQLGVAPGERVIIGGRWFLVIGVLRPVALVPDLDRAAFIGYPAAQQLTGSLPPPTTVFVRTDPTTVPAVEAVLAATAAPGHPGSVSVGRPSDILTARAATNHSLNTLLLAVGAVSVLVGGLGIANVMVVAVIERRAEIGLRRAVGASRPAIAAQFIGEGLALSALGGAAGAALGAAATAGWATYKHWTIALPLNVLGYGILGSTVIGAVAAMLPAINAARLSPTEALR